MGSNPRAPGAVLGDESKFELIFCSIIFWTVEVQNCEIGFVLALQPNYLQVMMAIVILMYVLEINLPFCLCCE